MQVKDLNTYRDDSEATLCKMLRKSYIEIGVVFLELVIFLLVRLTILGLFKIKLGKVKVEL
jgi:hypothetical protein